MLLETIRCESGEGHHLPYHQARLDNALKTLGYDTSYPLQTLISPPDNRIYRCRFLYDQNGYRIEYHPYIPKKIASLRLVQGDDVEYSLKFADRDALNLLYEKRDGCDDILIVKNGLITDTTIANIALYIQGKWITPSTPILEGTTRARLIENGTLSTAYLTPSDCTKATKVAIMNAMLGFVEVDNGIIT